MKPSTQPDSDSEDDPDYVPEVEKSHSSDEDNSDTRDKGPIPLKLTAEEEETKKRTAEALWNSFQASVASPVASDPQTTAVKTIKIEKRYRFAGEDVVEVKEVPEDSDEAKKWPLWQPPEAFQGEGTSSSSTPTTSSTSSLRTSQSAPHSTPSTSKPAKRPGPRKPKTTLATIPGSQKAKKLTTLEKSAMDWQSHVESSRDAALKDELEANRRGGGYLEKVDFLQRVEERREETFESMKSTKRRRT
ncbi:hypothetical protein JAAARDRAFT_32501 [Jaapia argillacea MUCL 33604]|uniref:SWR1-complex protein 5 n=1 Tax=Jaapia argillacea MUCL 33604 TaxID=933084 RepID=A0A067QBZ8_9AGAM|nr:hypothetical protein JAAARDRAFT_32501 [Jaapia argillacea MUCL 33604]